MLRNYLLSVLSEQGVNRVVTACEVISFVLGATMFYEARSLKFVQTVLRWLAAGPLRRFVQFGVTTTVTQGEITTQTYRDFPRPVWFITSVVTVGTAIVLGYSVSFWLVYPWRQFLSIFTVWIALSITWGDLLIPLQSVGYIFWWFISMLLIYIGLFGIPLKSTIFVAEWLEPKLNRHIFHLLLFALFLLSGAGALVLRR
jgi:hypothetical protein